MDNVGFWLGATTRATLTNLSCSPDFPCALYLDERTLMYESIVNCKFFADVLFNHNTTFFNRGEEKQPFRSNPACQSCIRTIKIVTINLCFF